MPPYLYPKININPQSCRQLKYPSKFSLHLFLGDIFYEKCFVYFLLFGATQKKKIKPNQKNLFSFKK